MDQRGIFSSKPRGVINELNYNFSKVKCQMSYGNPIRLTPKAVKAALLFPSSLSHSPAPNEHLTDSIDHCPVVPCSKVSDMNVRGNFKALGLDSKL